jgi:serine/threonine protein phosphatase PrpC
MMAEIIQSAPALSAAAHRLVKAANHVGGQDNISVVLLHLVEVPDIPT